MAKTTATPSRETQGSAGSAIGSNTRGCQIARASVVPNLGQANSEAGFTLVELLIIFLIVGILSAVALPLYLGYTKDARLAEARALGGSALTALSGCVQVKGSGSNCVVSEVRNRVGLDATNITYDGRWAVATAQLSVTTDTPPILNGTITVSGVPGAHGAAAVSLAFFLNDQGVTLRCNPNNQTPPPTSTSHESC